MHEKNRAGPQWNVKMNHTSVYHKKTNLWEKKENTLNDKQYA